MVADQILSDLALLQIPGHQSVAANVLKHAWHKPAAKPVYCNLRPMDLRSRGNASTANTGQHVL